MTAGPAPCQALGDRLDRIDSPWRVDPERPLTAPSAQYLPPAAAGHDSAAFRDRLRSVRKSIRPLQNVLYAQARYGVLLVFQALDAGGKDGAIREVLKSLDPNAVRVASFKRPSVRELGQDFLWRTTAELPRRGTIVAFNRSHYEEVLAVRVHPEFLDGQYNGPAPTSDSLWPERFRAIREHERHLANSHTVILKFWLNVSPERQASRFLERLEDTERHWKFAHGDVRESRHRDAYDKAITDAMNQTSKPWAPWFCIPADDRWYLRWQIADIVRQALATLPLSYPEPEALSDEDREKLTRELRDRSRGAGA